MSTSMNPYLVGFEQYLRRPNSERNRAESQLSSGPPLHTVLTSTAANRAPAAISRTNAPAAFPEPVFVQLMPGSNNDANSIDDLIPASPGDMRGQPAPADGSGSASTRPQTPTTLNIITHPPAGGPAGQMEQPAVEITISTQPEAHPYEQHFVSHLQGLTVQQMLDLDIDALVVKIDEHHSQEKKTVLDHFMETKARLIQSRKDAVEGEKSKAAFMAAAKEEELNLVKAEVDTLRIRSQRLWELVGRACTAYGNAKERRRTNLAQFQVFCAWREQVMLLARRRRLTARAEHWDANTRLKRNVFRAWFRQALRGHRVTLNTRYVQEVENAKRLIHEHYQRQISDMERALAEVHLQLEREAEARGRLEEDMKRAFMRGVCALNIEAMNMMKRGGAAVAPPGAANPSGGAAPSAGDSQPSEPAAGGSVTSSASAYAGQAPAGAQALSETLNLDLQGSITLSPRRFVSMPSSAGAGGQGGGGAGPMASTSGQQHPYPAAAGAVSARMSGSGASSAGMLSTLLAGTGGGSSRPGSSYGLVAAAGTGGGGRAGAVHQQSATALAGPGLSMSSGGGAEGGPAVRETAQTFYQRPQVVVTRGPGAGLTTSNAEAPRPRANAPLPTVRML